MSSRRGALIDRQRARRSARAGRDFPDVCSFAKPEAPAGVAFDAFFESTTEQQAGVANAPCQYKPLSAYEKSVGGKVVAGATHKIKLPVNEHTMSIAADQTVVVAARGATPALTFQVTGLLPSSTSRTLHLAATLRS